MYLLRKRSNGTYILDKREFGLRLNKILGFRPRNLRIYEMAFIHRSASHFLADGTKINNERLEYLGDAILDAILSEYLFEHYPECDEGELTKIRAKIVNGEILNKLAKSMGINNILISHVNKKVPTRHLYGDALEALIGSVFVDKGYKKTREFILRHILHNYIDLDIVVNTETDHKSQVFQWAQKLKKQISFNYNEDYDFNDKKSVFTTILRIDHEVFGEGTGSSKKEAEQQASLQAWEKINKIGFID